MKTIKRKKQKKRELNYRLCLILAAMLILGTAFIACEGPAGTDGAQGPQGEVGPIGPAGENGSMMWAGSGGPALDIGKEGDYYLNSTTGEFYGPKDVDGWGNPIMVLMGNDGADGQDGADGKDGSQIFAGTGIGRAGVPDESLGQPGDYFLNTSTYNLYGPKTKSGWGSPINIKGAKGADGNANVTRYIFSGHDFGIFSTEQVVIPDVESIAEMQESAWLRYLASVADIGTYYYLIPGYGISGNSRYRGTIFYEFNTMGISTVLAEGPGEKYDRIEVVRIEASNTEDLRKVRTGEPIIPDHLDTSDYEAVAEYYGFK